MTALQRARRKPGPFLLAVALVALTGTTARAHDPGLSSLDVSVARTGIVVTLAMSAADVALVAPDGEARRAMVALALDAIRVTIDGVAIAGAVDEVAVEEGGATRTRLSFPAPSSAGAHRVEIASEVPQRVARGHREMLIVKQRDRVLAERLLDRSSAPVSIDVAAEAPSLLRVAGDYLGLGIEHILSGYDHLVFLAALILGARRMRDLLIALTAFTVAHSVSLALVVVAGITAPPAVVEPLIAASIAWVGLEILVSGRPRTRWPLVFCFGLIHGFGFAGALIDLGLGSSAREMAVALLSFNAGVETGQLAVAAVMMPVAWAIARSPEWRARLVPACSLMITLAGGYWLIERLL